MIYVVIALLAVIAIALTFLRTYYSKKEKDDFRQVNQDETNKNTFWIDSILFILFYYNFRL